MTHYINKEALVAEIENIESSAICEYKSQPSRYSEGCLDSIHRIKSFINTLEAKEADLDEEIANQYEENYEEYLTYEEFADIAKHFFELGLKVAQKGE